MIDLSIVTDAAPATVTPPVHDALMNPADFDYGTDADPDGAVVAKAFADLDRLVLAAERATAARKVAEDALDAAKKTEDNLLTREIPALLESMRLKECVTASGVEVKVKREIRASLPGHDRAQDRQNALQWLLDGGHGGLIKNTVRVDLDRGEDTRADELVMSLRAAGFDPQAFKDVHAGTLSALIRELMTDGKIVPPKTFNLFDQKTAKLARK